MNSFPTHNISQPNDQLRLRLRLQILQDEFLRLQLDRRCTVLRALLQAGSNERAELGAKSGRFQARLVLAAEIVEEHGEGRDATVGIIARSQLENDKAEAPYV